MVYDHSLAYSDSSLSRSVCGLYYCSPLCVHDVLCVCVLCAFVGVDVNVDMHTHLLNCSSNIQPFRYVMYHVVQTSHQSSYKISTLHGHTCTMCPHEFSSIQLCTLVHDVDSCFAQFRLSPFYEVSAPEHLLLSES